MPGGCAVGVPVLLALGAGTLGAAGRVTASRAKAGRLAAPLAAPGGPLAAEAPLVLGGRVGG